MNNVLKRIQNSKGFVSIEVILIAGSIIILGALVLYNFNGEADTLANNAINQVENANKAMEPNTVTTP